MEERFASDYKTIPEKIDQIELDSFTAYPVSKKCIDFMLALHKNIPLIKLYVGSFDSLCKQYNFKCIYYKEHPLNIGYISTDETRDWITEKVNGYYPSLFSCCKKVTKQLSLKYT